MTAIIVTIGATDFPSFAAVSTADAYLLADVERFAAWAAQSADAKARCLASSTRLLQRLAWASGSAPLTDGTAPQAVSDACCLLAGDMATSPELFSTPSTASNVASVKAGPVDITFFRPVEGTPLPTAAWELLKSLLGSSVTPDLAYGAAYGTDACSLFDPNDYKPTSFQ